MFLYSIALFFSTEIQRFGLKKDTRIFSFVLKYLFLMCLLNEFFFFLQLIISYKGNKLIIIIVWTIKYSFVTLSESLKINPKYIFTIILRSIVIVIISALYYQVGHKSVKYFFFFEKKINDGWYFNFISYYFNLIATKKRMILLIETV